MEPGKKLNSDIRMQRWYQNWNHKAFGKMVNI